ncbi:response regulator [Oculatella sp. FACHB-28]|uniref:hybrid sensor histidine kinase/response regulator n=1 Tax=Cyanophyceae TaxID=3028117 RepID=UPI0016893F73|nr:MULTISPECIES: hybrid sensor histidine kinase/response regulator [Cyanophyceae]MBD2001557.1 response regulator [Leptolyngbya sp. FACHB-541]MBD2054889.1 response regulator [Oculatella sp. FACHB-28]
MKRQIRIDTLQWFIGIYIAIRGTLMLMVPHTLNTHVFVPIQPHLPGFGAWQVVAGAILIAAVTLVPHRSIVLFAHLLAGSALLQAASGHLFAGTWTAFADFVTLGFGTAIAPFLQTRPSRNFRNGIDLFALLMSIRMVLDGIIVLIPFNPQFDARLYDPVRPYLLPYGIAYLVSGLALLAAYFYPKLPKRLFQAAHLLAGGMLWSWTIGLGFPTWNSVLFYGGLGTLLALLPWLGPYLRRLEPRSLQTQLAVTLVGIVALPLLFIVTLIALPQEQAVINQALTLQQTLARALAQDVANYINLHRAAVHALAKQPNLAAMTASEQRNFLQLINQAYPDITVLTTYDAAGNAIARSDDRVLGPSIASFNSYRAAQLGQTTLNVRIGRVLQKPIFTFTAPFYDANQQFAGVAAGAIESSKLTGELIKTGETADIMAYLVNDQGRVIAHPDASLVSSFSDRSQAPPVAALLKQEAAFGGLHYWDQAQWQLAGYAQVPDIGWGIVVERPASNVLAALNARRNRDFQTLLAVAAIALIIGLRVARRLSNSLMTLAYATDQLTTGDTQAPLPQSTITEVAHLSNVFADMRDRLTRRTAERDQMEQEREKLLQRERIAREVAEAANRTKDEFLAVLSHELRSPLNPILGWSRLLLSGKLDETRAKQALTTIERNAKLQSELIEDLLDISRILRGKLSLTVRPVNLASVIQAAIETIQLAAEAKSIQIETRLNPKVGLVSGDSTRLQQVVWNLLSNAVKFTPEGGRVEVRLTQVDYQAQITVSDTGKGISPDFLPYVFDYFRQEDGATTRKFGGLGLGLAIARYLVELHGGTVQADSLGEGKGATFMVRVPVMLSQTIVNQAPQPLEFSLSLNGVQALVVDDDTDTRDFIEFLLEQAGAKVNTAASAREALTALMRFKPDVLLSDIGMPDMDGYMLLRQVRTLPPEQGGEIPAIALTAYAGELDQKQAIAAGFQHHIAKPVEPEQLVKLIALTQRSEVSSTSAYPTFPNRTYRPNVGEREDCE